MKKNNNIFDLEKAKNHKVNFTKEDLITLRKLNEFMLVQVLNCDSEEDVKKYTYVASFLEYVRKSI